jgi:hypothetical protein
MREWRKNHPLNEEQREKDSVRSKAAYAKRRGLLVPQPCRGCGSPRDTTGYYCKKCRAEYMRHYRDRRTNRRNKKDLQRDAESALRKLRRGVSRDTGDDPADLRDQRVHPDAPYEEEANMNVQLVDSDILERPEDLSGGGRSSGAPGTATLPAKALPPAPRPLTPAEHVLWRLDNIRQRLAASGGPQPVPTTVAKHRPPVCDLPKDTPPLVRRFLAILNRTIDQVDAETDKVASRDMAVDGAFKLTRDANDAE